ncbi:MAG: arsenate reductase ArsC [Desulfovibrionaceae bacterium]
MFTILFLCTGNSCRSQMADGFVNGLRGDEMRAYSAGVERHGLNPYAVKAMAEAGLDISSATSKTVDELPDVAFDAIVTLCGHARDTCPYFPSSARRVHVGFDDPPRMAQGLEDEEAIMDCYRAVRDQIRRFVEGLPASLDTGA